MVGCVDLRTATLWAQTTSAADVYFEFWPSGNPKAKRKTEILKTDKQSGFTAQVVVDEIEPGITYLYDLYINKKKQVFNYTTQFTTQSLWQWRTDPPAFSVATGSCNYVNEEQYDRPGKPYGSDHHIFKALTEKKPDAMIWLGDNTYLREVDWNSKSGMIHRYSHTRALPEIQALLASTPQYATWDDHDFGPNDSDGTWVHKQEALEVFKMFWGNPSYGVEGEPGVATSFKINDMDFFLLDNRYYRTPDYCKSCPNKSQLGPTQMKWFLESLAASTAPFKIVSIGGQFLTTNENHETFQHYYQAEHDSILAFIERENIKNVIFITGDRHFTELSKTTNSKGNVLYDLTTSSLTAGIYADAAREQNAYRVDGTLVTVHNFATLNFSGPRKSRSLEIKVFRADGSEAWSHTIKSQQ